MKLTQLLERACVPVEKVSGDAEVSSVVADSRQCGAGACFVAVKGPLADGHSFVADAIAAGASAVICQDPAGLVAQPPSAVSLPGSVAQPPSAVSLPGSVAQPPSAVSLPGFVAQPPSAVSLPAGVSYAVVPDTARALGPLAQAMLDWPARKLVNVGVTGTKGKSTITYLVRAILEAAGHKAALVGTISYETGSRSIVANNTTPGPVELATMMHEMVAAGNSHLVMEVSSHALDQGRVHGVDYAAAVFTNLTGEHLDYHKTMDQYLAAKRILFTSLRPGAAAVINADDPAGHAMAEAARKAGARVVMYGIEKPCPDGHPQGCDLHARIEHSSEKGSKLLISYYGSQTGIFLPLIGRHNVYNALAAAGACAALGVDWSIIAQQLAQAVRVPGRLERVPVAAPYEVFVDYAHTDDALKNVLSAVRPMTRGKLIALFGCGGDRDPYKRPRMAKVAEELADVVVVTSDNPRTEKPEAIIEQVLGGLSPEGRAKAKVEPNRRAAIRLAISLASEGDVIVLAGKGHEDYQIIGKEKIHFDDVEEAAAAMRERGK